jgi:hypothetical protein
MQSWIVILYSVRDLCVHYPEFGGALGCDFSGLCEKLGASSDWKQRIFLRRTIVAHGKTSWISVDEDCNITYAITHTTTLQVPLFYSTLYNLNSYSDLLRKNSTRYASLPFLFWLTFDNAVSYYDN